MVLLTHNFRLGWREHRMSEATKVEEAEPEPSWGEEELALMRQLIAERRAGEFLDREQSNAQIDKLIADTKKAYGL